MHLAVADGGQRLHAEEEGVGERARSGVRDPGHGEVPHRKDQVHPEEQPGDHRQHDPQGRREEAAVALPEGPLPSGRGYFHRQMTSWTATTN